MNCTRKERRNQTSHSNIPSRRAGQPKTARNTSRSAGREGLAPRPRLDLEFSEGLFVAFWPSKSKGIFLRRSTPLIINTLTFLLPLQKKSNKRKRDQHQNHWRSFTAHYNLFQPMVTLMLDPSRTDNYSITTFFNSNPVSLLPA